MNNTYEKQKKILEKIVGAPVTVLPMADDYDRALLRTVWTDAAQGLRYVAFQGNIHRDSLTALNHGVQLLCALQKRTVNADAKARYGLKAAMAKDLLNAFHCSPTVKPSQIYQSFYQPLCAAKRWYSALCLLTRDETAYLDEWIMHHLNIGIDHLFLYDNGVETDLTDFVQKYPLDVRSRITVVAWKGTYANMQLDCYEDFLCRYGADVRWVGFIDTDEFIELKSGGMNGFLNNFEDYGAVKLDWVTFNASGLKSYEPRPLHERFTKTIDGWFSGWGKVFVDPVKTVRMYIHNADLMPGCKACNEAFSPVNGAYSAPSVKKAFLAHYYTKSYEEWCCKITRGSCDPRHLKRYAEFFELNPDMVSLKEETIPSLQSYT